jgi:phage terminase small subunit
MPDSGSARKSVAAMRASGTANESRLRRQGRDRPPLAQGGIPEPPPGFDESARAAWDFFANELVERGTLAMSDGPALAELAVVRTELEAARQALRERGSRHYQNERGDWKTYPEVADIDRLQRRYVSHLKRFGLLPDERERVSVITPAQPADEKAAREAAAWAKLI